MAAPAVDWILKRQLRLELLCHPGPRFAVTKKYLARATGAKPREIEEAIHQLRADGVPIGSGGNGYFMAESPEQLDGTVRHLTSRIRKETATLRHTLSMQERMKRPPADPNGQRRFA